jgi:hypothetical protein
MITVGITLTATIKATPIPALPLNPTFSNI